ncbi:MAG: ABC transporter permease [Magnetococcales bacterium]|nr:ABC transporter permease [Magnetococcales bacterium]
MNGAPLRYGGWLGVAERAGRTVVRGVEETGFAGMLLLESIYWMVMGRRHGQRVRFSAVVAQMMEVGVRAVPIVLILSATIGVMLAIQGIYTLRMFGAEERVVIGIAFTVVREFAPMITGIVVAGRSGSALAARIASMTANQEVDALQVMAINPVRYLVTPVLAAMMIMLPCLTFFADAAGMLAAALYVQFDLGLSLGAFADQTLLILRVGDLLHGLGKSILFAILITLVGVANGASIQGGAEGVGRVTTRAVVHAIAAIVITDMVFAFLVTSR